MVIFTTIIAIIVVTGIVYFGLKKEFKNQYSEQTVENQVETNIEIITIIEENAVN